MWQMVLYMSDAAQKSSTVLMGRKERKSGIFKQEIYLPLSEEWNRAPVFQTVIFTSDVMTEAFIALIQGKEEFLQEVILQVWVSNE